MKLPYHKKVTRTNQIKEAISKKSISLKTIESILGRLENIATILRMFGNFLNNIRSLQIRSMRKKGHNVTLSRRAKEDLSLAIRFIDKAALGISMNTLIFRKSTKLYVVDACKHGLGGWASHGRSWFFIIPKNLRDRAHINLLEFLANVVAIWIDEFEDKLEPQDCILAGGDSTTAMGWLRRTNFREEDENNKDWEVKQEVARKLATIILNSESVLYRQWFLGNDNIVADSLSRDALFLSEDTHILFLKKFFIKQIPKNFHLKEVPKEICSFITSMLESLPENKQRWKQPKPSEILLGEIGSPSYIKQVCKNINSWKDFLASKGTSWSAHLLKRLEKHPSPQEIEENWWKNQSVPPSHMWLRPSGQTIGKTPDWTQMVKSASSSKSNARGTKTQTT